MRPSPADAEDFLLEDPLDRIEREAFRALTRAREALEREGYLVLVHSGRNSSGTCFDLSLHAEYRPFAARALRESPELRRHVAERIAALFRKVRPPRFINPDREGPYWPR